jgi:pimeloyl-ACP methyl ester carboxylesterase
MAEKRTNVHAVAERAARAGLGVLGKVTPGGAAEVAAALFSLPRRFERPERERALLEGGQPFEFVAAGVLHRGFRFGAGPAEHPAGATRSPRRKVLLVHGWEGRGAQLGAFVRPLVDDGYEVLLFDGKAHGDSTGRRVDARDFAEAVRAIAEREGELHAIIAHSMGGMAAAASRRLGVRASRWVVLGSPLSPEGAVAYLRRVLDLAPAVVARVERRVADRFGTTWARLVDGDLFRDGEAPLLVVHDHDDADVPFAHAARIAEAWGPAEVHATAGLGHRRILWDQGVVERVRGFVAAEAASRPRKRAGNLVIGS